MAEINYRGILRNEQLGSKPGFSTTLQLAQLVKRVKRKFDEKWLTGAVFLGVAKAFVNLWIESLLFKLTILEFPLYLVKIITSYLHSRIYVAAFEAGASSCRLMRAEVAQGE